MKTPLTSDQISSHSNLGLMRRFTVMLVRQFAPELLANRSDLLEQAKCLGEKLRSAKDEGAKWRQRCFSAENALYGIKFGIKKEIKQHDEEYGTNIHWS